MATKLYRFAAFMLTIVMLGGFTSCKESEVDKLKQPTVDLKLISTPDETESLKFSVTTTNATSFGYACVTVEDYKANKYEMIKVELTAEEYNTAKEMTVKGLIPSTRYTIVVEAYNGGLISERVMKTNSTNSTAPDITITDVTSTADGVSFKLTAEESATIIKYAIYLKAEGDAHVGDDEDLPTFVEWRNWKELTPVAGGNVVTEKMDVGDYVVTAYAITKTTPGDKVKREFEVMVQDRPYVKISTSNLTSEDGTVKIVRNKLCGNYYVGLSTGATYTFESALAAIKANGSKHLITSDYEGSIRDLVKETFSGWAPNTDMRLWVFPCDADGKYSENSDDIIQGLFTVPQRATGGNTTFLFNIIDLKSTSYKVSIDVSEFTQYYLLYNTKEYFATEFTSSKDIIEKAGTGLLAQTPQTAATQTISQSNLDPGLDYAIYAIGIDKTGKMSDLKIFDIKTEVIIFDSPASVDIQKSSTVEYATFTYAPKNGCTSVRYLFMSNTEFNTAYSASPKRVETALAMNNKQGIVSIATADLTKEQKKTGIEVNTTYILFTLPLDKDGKMGKMIETSIVIPAYETSNMLKFGVLAVSFGTPSDGKVAVRFSLLPDEGCYYSYARLVPVGQKFSGDTELIQTILSTQTGSILTSFEDGETVKKVHTFNVANNTNYYLYVLCRDAQGKYNNPTATRLYVDMTNKTIGPESK